ncbi:MAG: hypothetical protein JSW64_10760 [Candidatus Zixiibacteriota bacterium]|nr:MAG: hypothetical protein JSW64_10760 [candidate division Zixibacteria bacterium]
MKKHIELLGILHIVYHSMGLIGALTVLVFVGGGGLISCNELAIAITTAVALSISSIILIFSLPGVIGGIGLLLMKKWGRILTLVMGFLALPGIPFGTALGIYTIWALMNDETIRLFKQTAQERDSGGVS